MLKSKIFEASWFRSPSNFQQKSFDQTIVILAKKLFWESKKPRKHTRRNARRSSQLLGFFWTSDLELPFTSRTCRLGLPFKGVYKGIPGQELWQEHQRRRMTEIRTTVAGSPYFASKITYSDHSYGFCIAAWHLFHSFFTSFSVIFPFSVSTETNRESGQIRRLHLFWRRWHRKFGLVIQLVNGRADGLKEMQRVETSKKNRNAKIAKEKEMQIEMQEDFEDFKRTPGKRCWRNCSTLPPRFRPCHRCSIHTSLRQSPNKSPTHAPHSALRGFLQLRFLGISESDAMNARILTWKPWPRSVTFPQRSSALVHSISTCINYQNYQCRSLMGPSRSLAGKCLKHVWQVLALFQLPEPLEPVTAMKWYQPWMKRSWQQRHESWCNI